jgi:hypothetical protein
VRPRVIVGAQPPGVAAVEHERLDAFRVHRRHQDRHRPALGVSEQNRPAGPGGVHHRQHIMHPSLHVRQVAGSVRHSGPTLVEADQPAERAQPVEKAGMPRIGPVKLEVGNETGHQHNVPVPAPGHLESDLQAVADRVMHRLIPKRRRRPHPTDHSDEPVATAVYRADQPLGLPIVAHRLPGLLDPAGNRRLADEPAAPDVVHQLILGHHPVAVANQVRQHLEDLRFDPDPDTRAPQLDLRQIKLHILEGDNHSLTLTAEKAAGNGRPGQLQLHLRAPVVHREDHRSRRGRLRRSRSHRRDDQRGAIAPACSR